MFYTKNNSSIVPKSGEKITFKYPKTSDVFLDLLENQKLLEINKEYTLSYINFVDMDSSCVSLVEFPSLSETSKPPMFSLTIFDWSGRPDSSKRVFLNPRIII